MDRPILLLASIVSILLALSCIHAPQDTLETQDSPPKQDRSPKQSPPPAKPVDGDALRESIIARSMRKVRLFGTIRIPAEIGKPPVSLVFKRWGYVQFRIDQGDLHRLGQDRCLYRWDAGMVKPSSWIAEVDLGYTENGVPVAPYEIFFHVESTSYAGVNLVVPDFAEVTVRCLDTLGRPAAVSAITHCWAAAAHSGSGQVSIFDRKRSPGVFVLFRPAGEFRLGLGGTRHRLLSVRKKEDSELSSEENSDGFVSVSPGKTEVVMTVEKRSVSRDPQ